MDHAVHTLAINPCDDFEASFTSSKGIKHWSGYKKEVSVTQERTADCTNQS